MNIRNNKGFSSQNLYKYFDIFLDCIVKIFWIRVIRSTCSGSLEYFSFSLSLALIVGCISLLILDRNVL